MASADSTPVLEQAQKAHMEVGQVIYVRGRKAVVVDVDFPNIFWRIYGEEVVKHRSYNANPTMFQVPIGTPLRYRKNTNNSMVDYPSDSDDEILQSPSSQPMIIEADEFDQDFAVFENVGVGAAVSDATFAAFEDSGEKDTAHNAAFDSFGDGNSSKNTSSGISASSSVPTSTTNLTTAEIPASNSNSSGSNDDGPIGAYPDPKTARMNVMAAFAKRQPKLMFKNEKGESSSQKLVKTAEATATQGVIVESCEHVLLKSKNKLANLSIVECTHIDVGIPGAVSSVELLRCKDVQITCRSFGTTYQVEKSERVFIRFPDDSKDVKVVSINSPNIKIQAVQPFAGLTDSSIEESKFVFDDKNSKTIDLDTKLHDLGLIGEEGTPAIEILTRWNSVTREFEVQALKRDNREMPTNL